LGQFGDAGTIFLQRTPIMATAYCSAPLRKQLRVVTIRLMRTSENGRQRICKVPCPFILAPFHPC
jgi:hypothetical protein